MHLASSHLLPSSLFQHNQMTSPSQLNPLGRVTPPNKMASPTSSISHLSLSPKAQPAPSMGPPPKPNSHPQRVPLYGEIGPMAQMGPPQRNPQVSYPEMGHPNPPQMNPPQTDPSPRIWDPNAASYLWACQLRLEHVDLVNKLDRLNQILASVANTVDGLQHSTTGLQARVQRLQDDCASISSRVESFQCSTGEEVGSLRRMIDQFGCENNTLKARLDGLTRDGVGRDEKWTEVMHEVRVAVRAEMECLKGQNDVGDSREPKESDIVPDSMPVDSAGSDSRQDPSTQEFSQTTFGGSTQEDDLSVARHGVFPTLKQEGRSLAKYFAFAEGFRAQLPPKRRESVFVEAFLEGLEDTAAKSFFQSRANDAGWTWAAMNAAFRQLGSKKGSFGMDEYLQRSRSEHDVMAKGGQPSEAPATAMTTRSRGRKRRISIVSTDGEDVV